MKKTLLLILCLLALAASGQQIPLSGPRIFKLSPGITERDYLPNTVIVKFRSGSTMAQIKSATSTLSSNSLKIKSASVMEVNQVFKNSVQGAAQVIRKDDHSDVVGIERIYEFKFDKGSGIEEVINETLQSPLVEYAEPSYIYHTSYVPGDPLYGSAQSYLRQIKADQAWDVIRNSSGVIIAIVDSGSDLDHEDLRSNILLPGKDLVGASFATMIEDNDPDVKSDSTDHGVRVSGLASAVSNNGIGIASVGFNAKLLIVKAGADDNATAIYKGYEGIKYAADNGAHIINCSWGGKAGGSYGQDIINYAIAKGSIVIAAAGNDGSIEPDYPAFYSGVMAVTSVDNSDRRSSFANYGSYISISAPGETYTTGNRNNYTVARGTSFSVPLVSSAAALVKSKFVNFDMTQVKEQLRVTSDNIDAINSNYKGLLGKGRLNVFRAVTETPPSIRQQRITLVDKGRGSIPPGDTLRVFIDLKNFLSPATGLLVGLSSANADVEVIDQQRIVGELGTLELKSLVGAFRVFIKPSVSDNEDIIFTLTYTSSGGYTDTEQFTVRVALDYLNVEVNKISTTMTGNGRIGFSAPDAAKGLGFVYKGDQLLYEASLMIGNSSSRVSNNVRNDLGGADEHFKKTVRVGNVNSGLAAFQGYAEFDDTGNPNRLNLLIKSTQTAFSSSPDDKYTLVEYEIQNTGNTSLNGLYAALFTDWDVDAAGHDVTRFDPLNRIGFVYSKSGAGMYAGVKLVSANVAASYYPMSTQVAGDPVQNGGGLSIAEKYQLLSSGIKAVSLGESSPNGLDVMFSSGYGPFTIPVNGSVKVAFALVAGDNLGDLQASAQAAQKKYEEINDDAVLPTDGFILEQNFPNPARYQTVINFSISEESATSLTLYNLAGQQMRELVNDRLPAGNYSINVDVSELESGIYFYRMQYKGKEASRKLVVSK